MPANTPRGYSYPLYTDNMSGYTAAVQDLATDVDTDMGTLVTQISNARNRPSARATATAAQAVAANTDVLATFATEAYDNFNMIDLATDNTRVQLQQAGIYLLTARVQFPAASPAAFVTMVRLNSSAGVITNPGFMSISGSTTRVTEMTLEQLHIVTTTIPDNITLTVRHSFTASLNIAARSITATKVAATFSGT